MSIGSKPNIERLLTDYYVTPSNQIFNEKEVNIEIMPNIENSGKAEFSGNYKSETSSLKFNGIKLDSIDPKKTNFRTQKDNSDYEEKLIKLYEETFENILKKHTKIDTNEKISIVFVPIASEIHGVSLKEARAAAKVIFDFSKKHSNKINIRITTKNKIQSEAISAEFSKLQAQIL